MAEAIRVKDMTPEQREAFRAGTRERLPALDVLMQAAGPGVRYCIIDDRGVFGDPEVAARFERDWDRGIVPRGPTDQGSEKKKDRSAWRALQKLRQRNRRGETKSPGSEEPGLDGPVPGEQD